MTDPKPEKRGKGAGFWAVVVLGLLALYVLSIGPYWKVAADLSRRKVMSLETASRVYRTVYAPVAWLTRHSKQADEAYFRYTDWWLDETQLRGHAL